MDAPATSFNPHKYLKEQFVSNLTGSSMLEIFAQSAAIPALIVLRHRFCSNEFNTTQNLRKKNDGVSLGLKNGRAYLATLTMDFLTIVLPVLLFLTVLSEWTYLFTLFLMLLLVFFIAAKRYEASPSLENDISSLRKSISSYRVSVMIVTCLCILAVDFEIYPRRYAKTETYGTGLMDLGVGSFVLANSLVSKQARGFSTSKLRNSLQSTCPLIILGIARLVSTSSVGYQVHVGEYGVHWNFFFTLAAVSILTTIINVPPRYSGILGSLILIGYQVCLMHGLNVYLLSDERGKDIISQNKEGIYSILGYWGMYLVGVQLGSYLFFGNSKQVSRSKKWARIRVWILSVLCWLGTVLLDRHVERVSRRMCNAAYVSFVLAQNLQVLAILLLSDFIPGHKISVLEEAFNRNLLASFLLANLLTGLVNFSVTTLFTSSVSALIILVVYALVLSLVMGSVHFYDIKLKLWGTICLWYFRSLVHFLNHLQR